MSFCEFSHRKGLNTSSVKSEIESALMGKFHADITIIVDKEQSGPPQKPPVNIEVTGVRTMVNSLKKRKNSTVRFKWKYQRFTKIKARCEINKAEIQIEIDREYAKSRIINWSNCSKLKNFIIW